LPAATRKDSRLFKTIQLHPEISRAISAERLNIATERSGREYDLVVATNVFPYLTDAELALALANVSSMLRPGGYLIHNEQRPNLPILASAAGLQTVQVRGLVLASDARGAISDTVWIHTKAPPSNR
jgi:2-polyprenyl-3-methyl-5-hydroxy-6-metoxy-1,4-benzoquinol methylase